MDRYSSTGLRTASLLALVLAAALAIPAAAQFGGMPKKEEKKAPANKEDLKYIKCAVCEAVVKHAMKATKGMREAATAHKPVRCQTAQKLRMLELPGGLIAPSDTVGA